MSRNAEGAREFIQALFQTRSALAIDLDREAYAQGLERLLVLSNLTGTAQLCEVTDGELRELTRLPESVQNAAYVPGRRLAVVAVDAGGNERDQLYLIDLVTADEAPVRDFSELTPLAVDPRWNHYLAGVSHDGRRVAYLSNADNGVDFDLWLADLEDGSQRLLWASGGFAFPGSGFSPDDRLVSAVRWGSVPLDYDLFLIDVTSGEAHQPLPHPGEGASVGAPAWLDPSRFVTASNIGRDFAAVLEWADGTTRIVDAADGDVEAVAAADDGTLAITRNRDCATPITIRSPDGTEAAVPWAEPGTAVSHAIPPPILAPDGAALFYTLSTSTQNADVYRYDVAGRSITRLTHSPTEVDPDGLSAAELHTVASFDGEPIEFYLHRPAPSAAPPPAVVLVHGGPASQSRLGFDPIKQALVAAGYGVVVPNVRGSTGYGKRFAALDDTVKRLDSVADLAAVHGALGGLGLDPARAALWGGSYGGYMVLAGLAFQPELWAAGVDIVGISNFVTFLENTSAYRRANRESEYGSLEHDREFLLAASPLTRVDAIRAPLFVIHGANDPRVPVGEAEQLEANLRARGVPCELLIYANEGHGLARMENRLDAYPRAIAFLDGVLGR